MIQKLFNCFPVVNLGSEIITCRNKGTDGYLKTQLIKLLFTCNRVLDVYTIVTLNLHLNNNFTLIKDCGVSSIQILSLCFSRTAVT